MPKVVGYFDPAVAALPDERRVTLAVVLERFLLGIEVMHVRVLQEFWASLAVQFVAASVAITEKTGGAPFEMIEAQGLPLGRVLEFHGQLRVLVLDQFLPRISS